VEATPQAVKIISFYHVPQ